MYRETIIDNDDYTVDLEYSYGCLFLHCDVHNISKSVFKRMINDWLDMEEALHAEGFDRVYAVPQDKKGFISYTGWDKFCTVPHLGVDREVYVWELLK